MRAWLLGLDIKEVGVCGDRGVSEDLLGHPRTDPPSRSIRWGSRAPPIRARGRWSRQPVHPRGTPAPACGPPPPAPCPLLWSPHSAPSSLRGVQRPPAASAFRRVTPRSRPRPRRCTSPSPRRRSPGRSARNRRRGCRSLPRRAGCRCPCRRRGNRRHPRRAGHHGRGHPPTCRDRRHPPTRRGRRGRRADRRPRRQTENRLRGLRPGDPVRRFR